MSKVQEKDVVNQDEVQEIDESVDEVIKVARTKLSVRQKKELGLLAPKRPRTDKQKLNDERLREIQNKKSAETKKERDAYEISQLKKLKLDDINAFQEFLNFKKLRAVAEVQEVEEKPVKAEKKVQVKKVVEEVVDEDSDDYIQAKKQVKKAQKIAKAVEEIDNKINKLQITTPVNPYLELFNKKK